MRFRALSYSIGQRWHFHSVLTVLCPISVYNSATYYGIPFLFHTHYWAYLLVSTIWCNSAFLWASQMAATAQLHSLTATASKMPNRTDWHCHYHWLLERLSSTAALNWDRLLWCFWSTGMAALLNVWQAYRVLMDPGMFLVEFATTGQLSFLQTVNYECPSYNAHVDGIKTSLLFGFIM